MNRSDEVLITGLGLVSPFGNTFDEYFDGIKNKANVAQGVKAFKFDNLDHIPGVEIPGLPGYDDPKERILKMGETAIKNAILDWGENINEPIKIALVIGSGLGLEDQLVCCQEENIDESFLASLGEELKERVELKCEVFYIGNACAAGSHAISYGMDLLNEGCFDLVIAGGVDMLSKVAYAGFLRLNAIDLEGCRPFDKDRKGIMVGEGAVFFVLQKQSVHNKKIKKVYCSLTGSGITNDAYHVVQLKPDGQDIKRTMDEALKFSNMDKTEVDLVVAHGTGTILNDKTEAKVLREYFGEHINSLYVTAPKGAIGHTGGASGAFSILVAIGAILKEVVPPIFNLNNIDEELKITVVYPDFITCSVKAVMVNAFAFGGTNVVIICKKWDG